LALVKDQVVTRTGWFSRVLPAISTVAYSVISVGDGCTCSA